MVKTRENDEIFLKGEDAFYMGMLCFAIPVHELAFAVEGVSAAAHKATKEIAPSDIATEGIHHGLEELFESGIDTGDFRLNGTKIESSEQFIESMKKIDPNLMQGNNFSVIVEHLQRIFELNAHQENFIRRRKDACVIYGALCSQLEGILQPARDEANPQIILSEKLIQLLQHLESEQSDCPDRPIAVLLSNCGASKGQAHFPETMTVASVIGLLVFMIFSSATRDNKCATLMRELCESLSLSYDEAEHYNCQIWSAPTFDSPRAARAWRDWTGFPGCHVLGLHACSKDGRIGSR